MPKSPPVLFGSRHHFERDPRPGGGSGVNEAVSGKLERRLGRLHAKLRLGIEMDHEAQTFGQGINFGERDRIASHGERDEEPEREHAQRDEEAWEEAAGHEVAADCYGSTEPLQSRPASTRSICASLSVTW